MLRRTRLSGFGLVATSFVLAAATARADEPRGFVNRVHKGADGNESKYVVFVPHAYAAAESAEKRWPVIMFLHGAGERGDDGQKQVTVGLGPAIRRREAQFQFIAVFPQCLPNGRWQADSADGQRAMAILAEVEKEFRTDPDRVYLTGLSLGGMGTWSLAMKHPDRFAALAPICGRGDTSQAATIAKLPIWCFHGDADRAVTVEGSRSMIAAIKAAGGSPRYSEFPFVGHNSWDPAYATAELYSWLLEQKRKSKE
jgi:predicted peptidase